MKTNDTTLFPITKTVGIHTWIVLEIQVEEQIRRRLPFATSFLEQLLKLAIGDHQQNFHGVNINMVTCASNDLTQKPPLTPVSIDSSNGGIEEEYGTDIPDNPVICVSKNL